MRVYLATPYTSDDPEVRERRYLMACQVAAALMQRGHSVFSPIAHSHPIASYLPHEMMMDHEFWMRQDLPWLEAADMLVVCPADADRYSRGVAREVIDAQRMAKLVLRKDPEDFEIEMAEVEA